MKKFIPQFVITTLLAPVLFLLASSFSAQAQEYDDLYFTAGDRKKAKFLQEQESIAISNYATEDIDAKTINPDYIVKYNRGVADKRRQTQDTASEYYVEDYNRDNRNVIVNNYYGSGFSNYYSPYRSSWRYYDPFFDPFYDPFWSSRFYGPSWGWHSGIFISFGWSSFRRPYYSPWAYSPYYYDRFYSPWHYDRFYSPYYGYNRYYYGGIHNHYYTHTTINRNRVVYNPETQKYQTRDVARGRYIPRSTTTSVADGSATRRTITSSGTDATNGRIANYRDYSNSQNDYYRRTRTANTGSSSVDEGARRSFSPATTETPRTAVQNNAARVNEPVRRSTEYYNTRSYEPRRTATPTPSNNAINNAGNRSQTVTPPPSNNQRPNATPSRSTVTPSRERVTPSNSGTTPSRTYTPDRSTTPQRTYTPARSSDSSSPSRSNSGSSYSPSRSSSPSSGSSYTPSRSSSPSSGSSGTTPSRSSSGGSSDGSRRTR